jgi:hypothetical protein
VKNDPDKEWKDLLEPHAQQLYDLTRPLTQMSDEGLAELLAATDKVTSSNCWYATYHVAHLLGPEIQDEQARRRFVAEHAGA